MFESIGGTRLRRWDVVRLRAGSKTEVILLSRRFFSLSTHWDRVTIPCCGDGCQLCPLLPIRGLFYAAVIVIGRIHLLELGAQSAGHFEQHAKMLHGGMVPGLVFELSRRSAKSPVYSECIRTQAGASEILDLELAARVMALYKFPPPNPDDDMGTYERRCAAIGFRRNELVAAKLLSGTKQDA